LDGIDELTDEMRGLAVDLDRMDELMPQMLPVLRTTIDSYR
jgi:RND superfamily putative drug exporter